MTRQRSQLRFALPILTLALALAAFAAPPARAQYVYGVTALALDTEFQQAYGYSATLLDYYSCYYYDAAVVGTLYEGTTAVDQQGYQGVCAAEVYTESAMEDNTFYTEVSDHYIVAYIYYQYFGYYDPFGFGFLGSGDHGGGFNYYGCYCPTYFAQSTLDLGDTRVTLFNQGPCTRTPTLNGPASVTRGASANFTLANVCPTGQVRNWSFSDGTNTVSRGTSSAQSWSGTMATSGTVNVTVVQGGNTHSLSRSITVNPRNNWAFSAKQATKVANGTTVCDLTLSVPDPPQDVQGQRGFGHFCIQTPSFPFNYSQIGSGGPNAGFRYLTSAQDTTVFAWVITPQMENTTSDLYRAQCGRDGVIGGAQLRSNIVEHESGATNSHYSRYVAAQNQAANNIGVGLEAVVGPGSEVFADFEQRVSDVGNARAEVIHRAAEGEPCGVSDVTLDPQCNDHGSINYTPYAPCSPMSLNGQAASSSRVDLSWTDGSFNETGFRIERKEEGVGSFAAIASTAANASTHTDSGVAGSRAYLYRVIAFSMSRDSAASNEVRVAVPPPAPNGLSATPSKGRVDLAWSHSGGAGDSFQVERKSGAGAFALVATTTAGARSYGDTAVLDGTTYTYRVRATGPFGTSGPSNEASATTSGTAPTPPRRPGNLQGSAASSTQVNLSWTDDSSDETSFKIERSVGGSGFVEIASVGAGVTTFADPTVVASTTYSYQVRAASAAGVSDPSPLATVTTPAAPPVGNPPASPCCVWGQAYYGIGSVTLWWGDSSNDEDVFIVERREDWGGQFYGVAWLGANSTTATDYGLSQGQTYIYRIAAENAYGTSYSEEFYYYAPYWWEQ